MIKLLFSSAFAAITQRNIDRVSSSVPSIRLTTSTSESLKSFSTNTSHVIYTKNWAGAVLKAPPANTKFDAVSAQFIVPSPKGNGAASAWVGIDGHTYASAILQTGVDFFVENGNPSYKAWYEWYPDYAYDFTGIDISAGDVMNISVLSISPIEGIAEIINMTKNQKVSKTLTAPTMNSALGGQNAEWIVEDFTENGESVPLTNFGKVDFTGSVTRLSTGSFLDATNAELLDIKLNGRVMTSSKISGTKISVKYR